MGHLTHLLTDTVTMASEASISGYGDPVFGAQSTIAARVEPTHEIIIGTDGNSYKASHKIATEDEVTYTDRLWVPGDATGDVTAGRRPLRIDYATFPGGAGHYEVFL